MYRGTENGLSRRAWRLYRGSGGAARVVQTLRPYICPFGDLLENVPGGANVLDVGCGAGLLLGLLADLGRIREGYGFDANRKAVTSAQMMIRNLDAGIPVRVERRDAKTSWPREQFDVVTLIDVMHHVPPAQQPHMIAAAAERLLPGGLLIYKDMVRQPRWRAWCNRLHDLVLNREWIHYATLASVCLWAERAGLERVGAGASNMLWYGHEWVIYRRPKGSPGDSAFQVATNKA